MVDQSLPLRRYSVMMAACKREGSASSGDMGFYRHLASLNLAEVSFEWSRPTALHRASDGVGVLLAYIASQQHAPRAVRTQARLYSAMSVRPTGSGGPYDAVLAHLRVPRRGPLRALPLVWSSQGLAEREYYESRYGGDTHLEDVVHMYQSLAPRAERLVCWNECGAAHLLRWCPNLEGVVRIIHPPISGPMALPWKPSRDDGVVRILFVGGDAERKGLSSLIEAFFHVSTESGVRMVLNVIGPPLAVSDHDGLHFVGSLPETAVFQYMADSDIFVLPSKAETYGLSVAEAMAHGCAIVVSNIPALAELVLHGSAGLVTPVESPARLADALWALVSDDTALRTMQSRAFRVHQERGSPSVVAAAYVGLLAEIA